MYLSGEKQLSIISSRKNNKRLRAFDEIRSRSCLCTYLFKGFIHKMRFGSVRLCSNLQLKEVEVYVYVCMCVCVCDMSIAANKLRSLFKIREEKTVDVVKLLQYSLKLLFYDTAGRDYTNL